MSETPTPAFSFKKIYQLYDECPVITIKHNQIRNLSDVIKLYIDTYFFQTNRNNFMFNDIKKKKLETLNTKDIEQIYFNKLPLEVKNYFFKQNFKIYQTVMNPKIGLINNNDLSENYELNLFEGFLHKSKPFENFNKEQKDGVELFLSFMKEVLASNNEDEYNYILKWIANMAQGNKNDSCLYFKGIEGLGKSTFGEFLYYYVIGTKASTFSNKTPLTSDNNKELCGKLLVIFEELPVFSDREWETVSSTLKKAITCDMEKYCDKYEKKFECENLNNYIINTNLEALKHSEGRRYFLGNVSTKRREDHEYFKHLKKICFNKHVGEAFFSYLYTIDISDFNAQKDMPQTKLKLDAIADRLDYVYRFIKDMFIFQKKEINHTVKDLYDEYLYYMKLNDRKPCVKTQFCKKMRDVDFNYYASRGINKYHISLEKLKACATKYKWIHELDDYVEEEEAVENENENIADLQTENEQLKKEIKELKKKLNAYILTEGHLPTINLTVNNNNNNNNNNHDMDGERVIIPYNWYARKKTQEKEKSSQMMNDIADALLSNDVVFFSV
jgi:hypothetical protein